MIFTVTVFGSLKTEKSIELNPILITLFQINVFLIPAIAFAFNSKDGIITTLKLNKFVPWKIFCLAILGFICLNIFCSLFLEFQNFVVPGFLKNIFDESEKEALKSYDMLFISKNISSFLLITFIGAVVPAICEEAFFRGSLQSFLEDINPKSAIIYTSIIFGLFHFQLAFTIPLILIGLYLGILIYHTKSLYLVIVIHFLNNFKSIAAINILGTESENYTTNIFILIPALLAVGFILYIIIRKIVKENVV
jgi:membrane protease YdiL (CAAX protease family)